MRIEAVRASELGPAELGRWKQLLASQPELDSPYLRPEFTQVVAAVRKDVEVGLLEEGGRLVGFFPFQRGRAGRGTPVAGPLSDFHAVIVEPEIEWSPSELLKACRLNVWRFDHLPTTQTALRPYFWATAGAANVDLREGYEAYVRCQMQRGESFRRLARKRRRAQRDGSLRFEFNADPALLTVLALWKRDQYARTGVTDVLALGWTLPLLHRVCEHCHEDFAGVISAAYYREHPWAVLLSLRSKGVLHTWFSAHGPDKENLSPGLLLVDDLFRSAPAQGIHRLDLGKGPEAYKWRMANGQTMMAEGRVDLHALRGFVCRQGFRLSGWLKRSRLRQPLLTPARWLRRQFQGRAWQ